MLELLLLRHAKSRSDEPETGDHDRDLAPRGEQAAARMGRLLREQGLEPDLVLCSTARRAVHTWRLAAPELTDPPSIQYDDRLYLAAPARMLQVIAELGADAGRLLLVGHNPGMHHLATRLVADGDRTLRAALAAKFPTAALAWLAFAAGGWAELGGQDGDLRGFWRPRDLGR